MEVAMAGSDRYVLERRVSLGAVLAGALATLAATTILWLLGLGITLVLSNVSRAEGGFTAAAIVLIAVVLVGCAIGGAVAGWLSGTQVRRLGAGHALLSWALAFLVSTFFCMMIVNSAVKSAGGLVATTAQTAVTATAQATAARGGNVAGGAYQVLVGLGYAPREAEAMVADAQRSIQQSLHRGQMPTGAEAEAQATNALNSLLHYFGGVVWIYMGTWFVGMLLALGFGLLASEHNIAYEPLPSPGRREPIVTTPGAPIEPSRPLITPPMTPGAV